MKPKADRDQSFERNSGLRILASETLFVLPDDRSTRSRRVTPYIKDGCVGVSDSDEIKDVLGDSPSNAMYQEHERDSLTGRFVKDGTEDRRPARTEVERIHYPHKARQS